MLLENNSDILNFVIGVIIVLILFACFLCPYLSLRSLSYSQQRSAHSIRYRRYYLSYKKNLEQQVKEIMIHGSEEEFREFCKDVRERINYQYSLDSPTIYHTRMKRAVLDVINRNTLNIPQARVKEIEQFFPLLHRVYFGPRVTHEIYSDDLKRRKFHFKIREGEQIPELRSIIDLAYFFKTNASVLLGYAYTQAPADSSYFITKRNGKRQKEYKSPHYTRYLLPKNSWAQKNADELKQTPIKHPSAKNRDVKFMTLKRLISVPKYHLKSLQRQILREILEKAVLKPYCTGFHLGGSTVINAQPHVGAQTLVKMDLKNFFPSLKLYHVFQVFRGFGYCRPVAGILTCLCTDFFNTKRFLPQGAPTSPMISNLYGSILDARLSALWQKAGFTYTRYADDITCSSSDPHARVDGLIETSYRIIKDEGLYPKHSKTRILRKGHRKEVTGIVVNEHLNLNRKWIRRFRAELHHYLLDGLPPAEAGWQVINQLQGKLSYLFMVNPSQAQKYLPQVKQIFTRFAKNMQV